MSKHTFETNPTGAHVERGDVAVSDQVFTPEKDKQKEVVKTNAENGRAESAITNQDGGSAI